MITGCPAQRCEEKAAIIVSKFDHHVAAVGLLSYDCRDHVLTHEQLDAMADPATAHPQGRRS